MADILKGLTGGTSVFLFAWLFPCAIAVGSVAFFLFPALPYVPVSWNPAKVDFTKLTLLLAFTAVGLALLLSGLETRLYRILEGYDWPGWRLRQWGVRRERERRRRLQRQLDQASERRKRHELASGATIIGWEETLWSERLSRFPIDDQEIAPTRLANALRAFETYGWNRFRLDSQTLWTELYSLASDALRQELDQSRATVDFLVAMVYLTTALGLIALSGALWPRINWLLLVISLTAFILARLWYLAAVASSSYWYGTVQALVDVTRADLAKSLGLRIPDKLAEERQMWEAVSNFIFDPYAQAAADRLDRFRIKAEAK